jgi:hypothetical protein
MRPGNHESAGKRLSGKTRKGSPWLRAALVEAAQAAGRTRHSYLRAQFQRLATRRGKRKAAVAVGPTILVIVYHLLRDGTRYEDLGATYFDDRDRQRVERRLAGASNASAPASRSSQPPPDPREAPIFRAPSIA